MVLWFDWAQLTMFPGGTLEVLCEAAVNGGWGWSHQKDHLDAGLAGSLSFHLNSSSLHTAFSPYGMISPHGPFSRVARLL